MSRHLTLYKYFLILEECTTFLLRIVVIGTRNPLCILMGIHAEFFVADSGL